MYDTVQDFFAKIEWEGGIYAAWEYGLQSEDCPDAKVRELWEEFSNLMNATKSIASDLEELMNESLWEGA